jgi:DNA polymerase-3 subunit delta
MVAGTYPGLIISAAQRQVAALHKAALAMEAGASASSAAESGFPRLHFSRKAAVETALRNFGATRLAQVMDQLATAALDVRKQSMLAPAIAQRALMSIAVNARRRG